MLGVLGSALEAVRSELIGTPAGIFLGLLSNVLVEIGEHFGESVVGKAVVDTVVYGIMKFEPYLRELAASTETDLDDKTVDELIEACKELQNG